MVFEVLALAAAAIGLVMIDRARTSTTPAPTPPAPPVVPVGSAPAPTPTVPAPTDAAPAPVKLPSWVVVDKGIQMMAKNDPGYKNALTALASYRATGEVEHALDGARRITGTLVYGGVPMDAQLLTKALPLLDPGYVPLGRIDQFDPLMTKSSAPDVVEFVFVPTALIPKYASLGKAHFIAPA